MKAIYVLVMGAALLAAPLYAQSTAVPRKPATMPMKKMQPMPPSEDMMAMMMSGGMKAKTDVASISLSLRESLDVTADQVARLTALQASSQAEMMQHMAAHSAGMRSAAVLTEAAAPDLTAYEAALRAAANHMVLEHLAMARADVEARAVLTPIQRDRLVLARRVMKEMRAGMMAEMMKDGKAKMGAMPPAQPDTRLP
ncbi:Spy/CpxP family protein refolding chaperone [Gemmatimonas sp.]|uniref:Spy/CpxP family protein refolding chaperone n=1 Tax=Gemmatimonas sp. TaxID=1962908 RepID=UPI00286A181F|nr:Spy/CpxP family protein refolding chaperone [Gemmatimonas sp.]